MDHVAILRKAKVSKGDNLLKDIIDGLKTVESRWYVHKIKPWNSIKAGDFVYLKESGRPVKAVCEVWEVKQYENISPAIAKKIIRLYGKLIAPGTTQREWMNWSTKLIYKRYCILIFIKNVREIEPFNIDKSGFGSASAWLSVGDVNRIKR